MIKKILFVFPFLALLLLASCSHYGTRIRPAFSPTIKLTTIMYRNMDEEILFAGPINLRQNEGKDYVQVDFTALFKNKKCDSIRCNFTVYTHNANFSLGTFGLQTDSVTKTISQTEKMYLSLNNKTYLYRYGFYITESEFDHLLISQVFGFAISTNYTFNTGKKWKKQSREIKQKADMLRQTF